MEFDDNELSKLNKNKLINIIKSNRRSSAPNKLDSQHSVDVTPNAAPLTLQSMELLLDTKLQALSKDFANRIEQLEQENSTLRVQLDTLSVQINSYMASTTSRIDQLETKLSKTPTPNNTIHNQLSAQQDIILTLQRKEIENNLVIHGIQESTDSHSAVSLLLPAVGVNADSIDRIFRIGKKPDNNKPRTIKVILKDRNSKFTALKNAKNLRKDDKFKGIYINSDQIKCDRLESTRLRRKFKQLRTDNPDKLIELKRGILSIDGVETDRSNPIMSHQNFQ